MLKRFFDRLWFRLEIWIQRGPQYQLLVVGGVITLISLIGGLLAFVLTDAFDAVSTAIWWSFLRLSDPGYLGDDEGVILRTISTIVTVLGYVLFLGSLVAIMTQWWRERMEQLERGFTPIALNGHILVIGWTNRTPEIIRELVHSQARVKRFLRRRGTRSLRIVILAQQVTGELIQELRDELGEEWDEKTVILRSGSSLQIDHLRRADFAHASVIVHPAGEYTHGSPTVVDARILKTLMTITDHGAGEAVTKLPPLVTEIFDADKEPLAHATYTGELDVIPTNSFLSRLIAQNIRHPGLSYIFEELLTHRHGNDIYIRSFPDMEGTPFREIRTTFSRTIPLGVVQRGPEGFVPRLNPSDTYTLSADDRIVFMARTYSDTDPRPAREPEVEPLREVIPPPEVLKHRRVLMLGWSPRMPALIEELSSYRAEAFEITILSSVPARERRSHLAQEVDHQARELSIEHLEGEITSDFTLKSVDPGSYDNIIFLGSHRMSSGEASDARSILGFMLLQGLFERKPKPQILLELMDPENAKLFQRRPGEILVSARIISHVLAHVALRRELNVVFDELFTSEGAEIFFRPAGEYGATGKTVTFYDLWKTAASNDEIALGVYLTNPAGSMQRAVHLNPLKTRQWNLKTNDQIIVLMTYDNHSGRVGQKSEEHSYK
jgi:hypothetical protein